MLHHAESVRTSRVLSHKLFFSLTLTASPLSWDAAGVLACVLAARVLFVVAGVVVRGTDLLAARVAAPVRYTFQNTAQVIVACCISYCLRVMLLLLFVSVRMIYGSLIWFSKDASSDVNF